MVSDTHQNRNRNLGFILILMPRHFCRRVQPVLSGLLPEMELISLDPRKDDHAVIQRSLARAEYLIWSGTSISRDLLEQAPNLKLIQKWGSGIDGIDLLAVADLQVPFANVPGGNAVAVSEHAIGLILALYKRIVEANADLHRGRWNQAQIIDRGISELKGKTLGILGMGNIAKCLIPRVKSFGMHILYNSRTRLSSDEECRIGINYLNLHELVREVDILVVAVALNSSTHGLVNYRLLRAMKKSAILINISRGAVVIEADLRRALFESEIAGAGLDVFEDEPIAIDNPILALSNCIVTPHIAGRTKEALEEITKLCARNILLVAQGRNPHGLVAIEST